MTGAYSITMGAAAAAGSAMVVPLALAGFGWRGALLLLMVFPLLALLLWLPQARRRATTPMTGSGAAHNRGIWRSALAWQVTLFLGINSLVYYVIVGWLPAILQSMGYSEAQAGSLHGLLQLATAAPGPGHPAGTPSPERSARHRRSGSLNVRSKHAGIMVTARSGGDLDIDFFGFGSGATMILGLTFIGLRASSAHQAAALSGMAQTIGYLLAACGPPLIGKNP